MSGQLRWIRGAGRRPRYVGFGRSAPSLYRYIDDLQGRRGTLERLVLATAGRLRGARISDAAMLEAERRLNDAFPDASSALLVYTGYYKSTVLSGVVTLPAATFVKVFRELEDHEPERQRHDLLRAVVPDGVVIAPLRRASAGIVAYELLVRGDSPAPDAALDRAAVDLGAQAYANSTSPSGTWDAIVRETARLLEEYGVALAPDVVDTLGGISAPSPVAHGDFTPWNAFSARDGRIALVDYERVGPRAPFTDAWHLLTQQAALDGLPVDAQGTAMRVQAASGCDNRTVLSWYCAYLLEELNLDGSDWVVHGRHHPQLARLIGAKRDLLDRTVAQVAV